MIEESITELAGQVDINKLITKHKGKIHFIPFKYRVLGGFLQSLNIRFGNFVETLLPKIIRTDPKLDVIGEISGHRDIKLRLHEKCERSIDDYINRPLTSKVSSEELANLINGIFMYQNASGNFKERTLDIDTFFKDEKGKYWYIEVKYNDDHDTGKFVSINSKFLKTYAGLVERYEIKNKNDFGCILYYYLPSRRYISPYLREGIEIMRGRKLFDKFNLSLTYGEIESKLTTISEELEGKFDEFREKIFRRVKERLGEKD